MPKPTAKPVEETVDATIAETDENTAESAAEATPRKERAPLTPLTETQQILLVKAMKGMRKGSIPGSVTPSRVAAYLKTLPEFADIADKLTPVKVSSTAATLRRQHAKSGLPGAFPEFDSQHSAKVDPAALAALLEE